MDHHPNWKVYLALLASMGLAIALLFGASVAVAEQDEEVDLSIELRAPQHVAPGGTFVVNVIYSNLGTAASPEDSWAKVTLPAGTSFVSATDRDGEDLPPDAIDGNILTWQIGSLEPITACYHILITVQVAEDLPEETSLTVQAEIGSSAVESVVDNNVSSITSIVCDMAGSTKQAHAYQVKPGEVVTYTLTLRMAERHGPEEANQRHIELTDFLPPAGQASFLGWTSPTTGTYDGEHLHWQGQMRAGEPVTLQYRLRINAEVPPGRAVLNRAHVGWDTGEMDIEPVSIATYLTENEHMFGPQGGLWQHQYGMTLEVPPNALQAMTRFEFRPLFEDDPPSDAPAGYKFAHRAFELTAFQAGEIHRFNQPITITVGYNGSNVFGLNRNTLRLWYRTGTGEPWAMLGEPQTHQYGQIGFETDHFTQFALFAQEDLHITLPLLTR